MWLSVEPLSLLGAALLSMDGVLVGPEAMFPAENCREANTFRVDSSQDPECCENQNITEQNIMEESIGQQVRKAQNGENLGSLLAVQPRRNTVEYFSYSH